MMLLIETFIFYLLIGSGVAVAIYLRNEQANTFDFYFQIGLALFFWPLFVPVLLNKRDEFSQNGLPSDEHQPVPEDELTVAISQVEKEFEAALKGLDGWAENVLSSEQYRLEELRSAWNVQADRIRELDLLLAQPDANPDSLSQMTDNNQRVLQSEETRQENIHHLKKIRNQMHVDLLGTLAWVRELVTMIHLAKFSGAPASRAEELIAQIAAAVEGFSEVNTWKNEEQSTSV